MKFIIQDARGKILRTGSCPEDHLQQQAHEGETVVVGEANDSTDYIENGVVIPMPSKPSEHHRFNYTLKQWQDPRTPQDLKAAQWAIIKQARQAAEFGGFIWGNSTFDSDSISQSRIQGAVQLAGMGAGFAIDWTLANNTVRTLIGADMAAVGVALGQHVAAQHAKARALRAQIEAASTAAQVAAVVW